MYREARLNVIEAAAFVATFPCTGNQSGWGSEANFPAGEGEQNNPQLILDIRIEGKVTLLQSPWILETGNHTGKFPGNHPRCVVHNVDIGLEGVDWHCVASAVLVMCRKRGSTQLLREVRYRHSGTC